MDFDQTFTVRDILQDNTGWATTLNSIHINDIFSLGEREFLQRRSADNNWKDFIRAAKTLLPEKRGNKYSACVFYSGGLESAVMASQVVTNYSQTQFLNIIGIEDFKDYLSLRLIEPILYAAGAKMGYRVAMVGLALTDQDDCVGLNEPYGRKAIQWMGDLLGINILQPVGMSSKYTLFKQAMSDDMIFNSCSENDLNDPNAEFGWCGECFKCFQIQAFLLAGEYADSPYNGIDMKSTCPIDRYEAEICSYLKDGLIVHQDGTSNDPFTDNGSFLSILDDWNRHSNTIPEPNQESFSRICSKMRELIYEKEQEA